MTYYLRLENSDGIPPSPTPGRRRSIKVNTANKVPIQHFHCKLRDLVSLILPRILSSLKVMQSMSQNIEKKTQPFGACYGCGMMLTPHHSSLPTYACILPWIHTFVPDAIKLLPFCFTKQSFCRSELISGKQMCKVQH